MNFLILIKFDISSTSCAINFIISKLTVYIIISVLISILNGKMKPNLLQ